MYVPVAHTDALGVLKIVASTKLHAETSKIVGCVARYCEEKLDPPQRDQRQSPPVVVSHDKCAIDTDVAMKRTCGTERLDDDADRAPVKDLSSAVQVQTKATEPRALTQFHTRWQDDQDRTCKSCGAPAEVKRFSHGHVDRGESCCRWKLLEENEQVKRSRWDYSVLQQSGDEWLRRVVAMHDTLSAKKEVIISDALELWHYGNESPTKQSLSDERQNVEWQQVQFSLIEPSRLQCDWHAVRESGEGYMYDESSRVFQKVTRAIAQVTLLMTDVVIPNVFEGEWGQSLCNTYPTGNMEELQQLLLPFNLVRDDEAKVIRAPSKIISIADGYLHSLQRTDISLTMASLNIPSVWNHTVTLNGLANLVAEELKTVVAQPKLSVSPRCISVPVPRQTHEVGSKSAATSPEMSPSAKRDYNCNDSFSEDDLPPLAPAKLAATADLSTDYLLSETFLRCDWSDVAEEINSEEVTSKKDVSSNYSKEPLKYNQLLQQIARPALWDLMCKKLLQVDVASFSQALNHVSLEALEAIIYKQCQDVRKMSLNPSTFSSIEIVEACTSLRQATWLHTLRIVSISQIAAARNDKLMAAVLTRILPSAKYKLLLGPSNWKDLLTLLTVIGAYEAPSDTAVEIAIQETTSSAVEDNSTPPPPKKRQKVFQAEKENIPVRVLCSLQFLQQDELLDELCTNQQIFFIERDLPSPIDMLVDERNCICVVTGAILQVEANMRDFIFSLARLQLQFEKCWFVIGTTYLLPLTLEKPLAHACACAGAINLVLDNPPVTGMEDTMNMFFSALVQFRVEIQVLTSFSCEEAGRFVRAIVNQCAEVALNDHLILPRMWFERPFLLEDESQFERFLVSTKIVNNYAAQSLLHKICMEDLFSKSINELKPLVQNAVTEQQLELLWRLVQQRHGLNGALQ